MEHTEYYQLSLWEQDDRILREDFNQDNAKIDAALAALQASQSKTLTGTFAATGQNNVTIDYPIGMRPKVVIAYTDHQASNGGDYYAIIITENYFIEFSRGGYAHLWPCNSETKLTDHGFSIQHHYGAQYGYNAPGSILSYTAYC